MFPIKEWTGYCVPLDISAGVQVAVMELEDAVEPENPRIQVHVSKHSCMGDEPHSQASAQI